MYTPILTTITENRFTYTGEEYDPNSGFLYLRQRWANPATGRFISIDPFEGDPQTPISLNRYLYAAASPVSFSDPSGEFFLSYVTVAFDLGVRTSLSYLNLFANTLRITHTRLVSDLILAPAADGIEKDLLHLEDDVAFDLYEQHRNQQAAGFALLKIGFNAIGYLDASLKAIRASNTVIASLTSKASAEFGKAQTTELIRYLLKIDNIRKKVDAGADEYEIFAKSHQQ